MNSKICQICFNNIDQIHDADHEKQCLENQIKLLYEYQKDTLTIKQQKALEFSLKKSRIFSKNIHENLMLKFIERGLNGKDLENVVNYVKSVPVIIHVNLDKTLKYFVNDIYYKNLFETRTTGGSNWLDGRIDWENQLFNNIYHDAENSERVKYGTLNITNNTAGVNCCKGYGDSYLILKEHVKDRITFIYGDSSKKDLHICTFKHFNSILLFIEDKLLNEIIEIANNKKNNSTILYGMYIEAQIHGQVNFNKDIELLMVNKKHNTDSNIKNLLDEFSENHEVPYLWIE